MQSSLYYEDDSKLAGPLMTRTDLLAIEVKHNVPEYRIVDLAADKTIISVATMASSQKSRPDTVYIKLSNLPP